LQAAQKKPLIAQKFSLIGLLAFGPLVACEPTAVEPPATPPASVDTGCGVNGALQTALFGSLQTAVNWSGSEMMCESMQRPDGEGIRLRFAGPVAEQQLAIIIAIPGMRRAQNTVELPSNVTTTVEGSGRFFSTPNLDSCWTDIDSQAAVSGEKDSDSISGTLYCVAPLGEVNGDAAVSIPELSFTTIVEWKEK